MLSPVGSWRNTGAESIWTITAEPGGKFYARESGLGNAEGPAFFTPSGTFRIEFSGGTGFYELRFASDYRSAQGYCNTPSNTFAWVRVDQPSSSPTLSPVGSWRNTGADSTWTITAEPGGKFYARERGLGNAHGAAFFTPNGAFRIEFYSGAGFYELRFASDYRSAQGYCNTPGNTFNWVRSD
jgi:hypothetical protein